MNYSREMFDTIYGFLDLSNDDTYIDYHSWDKGDCSLPGLIVVLLRQESRRLNKLEDNRFDVIMKLTEELPGTY